MANLQAFVPQDRDLSEGELQKIQDLQDEIDQIWSKRGNYQIDPDAWTKMPLFMDTITEEDVANNESCAALAALVYDEGLTAEEIAENRKNHGNESLQRALKPDQVNKANVARAAAFSYTEGIDAGRERKGGVPPRLLAQLYSNRSLAQFIIQNFGHALQDAQRAILADPLYIKSYYRGAKAALALHKHVISLDLIHKAREANEAVPLSAEVAAEFDELEKKVLEEQTDEHQRERRKRLKTRVARAETSNLLRDVSSLGIKLGPRREVTSEQFEQLGGATAYFDADGSLHVPMLFLYDEFDQSDMVQDVDYRSSLADVLEDMLPFPWDTQGRYATCKDLVAVFIVDDGVAMPEYYTVDMNWPLLEVMRLPSYRLPGFLPSFHILSRHSTEILGRWKPMSTAGGA